MQARSVAVLGLFAVLVPVAGCIQDSGTVEIDGGVTLPGSDGGRPAGSSGSAGSAADFGAFQTKFFDLICGTAAQCCGWDAAREADCAASFGSADLEAGPLADGWVTFDSSKAKDCLARARVALNAANCDPAALRAALYSPDTGTVCQDILVGHQPDGASCSHPSAVNGQSFTVSSDDYCVDGLVCIQGVCGGPRSAGAPCDDAKDCGAGLACLSENGTCGLPIAAGDPCQMQDECQPGLACDETAETPTCAPPKAEGAPCDQDEECAAGNCDNSGERGVCGPGAVDSLCGG